MKKRNLNRININYIPLGFAIPFIWMLILMIIGEVLPFGEHSLLYSDGYHQYYPFFKEFRRALLSGDSLLYSWNVGMGIDYLGLISYYVASPLNLLSVLIPEEGLLYYFTYLTPIRLGLAGLFFSLFLNGVFKRKDLSIPLFGSFYALCAWSLGYQWNVMWLDTFVLLPLVALGTYKLLSEKRIFLYTVTLFLSIFSNYYIGFFTCIFVLITFICYEICRWKGFKKFILDLCRIALFSALAIGMTAILELPTLSALQTTQSSVNKFPKAFELNIVEADLYKQVVADNYELAKSTWESNNRLDALPYVGAAVKTCIEAFIEGVKHILHMSSNFDAERFTLIISQNLETAKSIWDTNSKTEALPYIWTASKTAFKALFDGMKQVAGNTTGGTSINFKEADALPNLYCGVITLFFSSLFLTCKQIKVRDKICSVCFLIFLTVSFLIRQLDYIWHGFHFTNMIPYRFSFIYSFVMLYMAYRAYLLIRHIKPWQVLIAAAISYVPVLVSNDFGTSIEAIVAEGYLQNLMAAIKDLEFTEEAFTVFTEQFAPLAYLLYNFALIFAVSTLLLISSIKCGYGKRKTIQERRRFVIRYRKRRQLATFALLCLFIVELGFNMGNYSSYWSGATISNYPKGTDNSKFIFDKLPQSDQFYRTETTHAQVLNDAALNGYNGISTFTSSANVRITRFMQNLGYGAKDTYNRYCYESGSPVADLFLNIKYVVDRDGFYYDGPIIRTNSSTGAKYTSQKTAYKNPYYDVIEEKSLVALAENNAYLPLGFLCESGLEDFDFSNNTDQFEFEENLIQAATGQEFKLWYPVNNANLNISGTKNVTVTAADSFGKCRYSSTDAGSITYAFTANRSGLFCMDINQSVRNGFSVWLNNNHDGLPDERIYSETYSLPQFLSVCAVNPGDVIEVKFDCKANDTGRIEVYGAIIDEEAFRTAHNILSESTYKITSFSNTKVEGTINCHKSGIMYTSIPQNGENWHVYVDGAPAKMKLIGDVMIGVDLEEGLHTVTFKYENKSFIVGTIVTIVSAVVFIILSVIIYRRRINEAWAKIKRIRIKRKGKFDKPTTKDSKSVNRAK